MSTARKENMESYSTEFQSISSESPLDILLIDNDPAWRKQIVSEYSSDEIRFMEADRLQAVGQRDLQEVGIIIFAWNEQNISYSELMQKVRGMSPTPSVIMITPEKNLELTIALMRRGDVDCLSTQTTLKELKPCLTRALEQISDRRRYYSAEQARQSADAFLAEKNLRLQSSLDPLLIINMYGTVLSASDSVEKVFGWEPDELIARNVRVLIPEPHHSQHDGYLESYKKTGKTHIIGQSREYEALRKDGTVFPCEITVNRVDLPEQNQQLLIGILRDISERKQIEEALQKAKESAEVANQAKTNILANISHEIRTPMTAILGFVEMLRDPGISAENRDEVIETISRNGRHLLRLINDILDISKVEAGELTVEFQETSPCRIIINVMSLLRVQTMEKNLSLNVHFDGPIPRTIQTDPTRLHQILMNLVGNAIKFTESGKVEIIVSLEESTKKDSSVLRIDVKDTGIGIHVDQLERIYEPFKQVDMSMTRRFGGTGLGLAISKQLAELLGGCIHVSSKPGLGSTFSLTVATGPLEDVELLTGVSEATFLSKSEKPVETSLPDLEGLCVLVVDDGDDNQLLLSHLLKKSGAEVTIASNGQIAVDTVMKQQSHTPFDLILMDIQIPILDGCQATELLRKHGFDLPIIALTAHARPEDRQQSIDVGYNDFG